jgi:zinc protease
MRRGTLSVVAALLAVILFAACGGHVGLPPARRDQRRTLDFEHRAELFRGANGLTFLFLPDHQTNLVKVDVRYRVGSKEDPAGKAGLAHLVEHMVFQVRVAGEGQTIEESLASAALYHNASTTWDSTEFSAVVGADRLDEVLALEAARMRAGCRDLEAEAFAREREVVRNEIRQRGGVAAEMAQALLTSVYGRKHAYGRLPGGTDEQIAALTLADVCRFMDQYYATQRAIVVVTGDVEVEALRGRVSQVFGSIAPRAAESLTRVERVRLHGTVSRHHMKVVEATAFVAFAAPPAHSDDAPADDVLLPLFQGELAAVARKHSFITDVELSDFGGESAPLHVVMVSVNDPSRLRDAVAAVQAARDEFVRELLGDLPTRSAAMRLAASSNRRRAELLTAVEPLFLRGPAFADYLQFTRHNWFVLRDLGNLARLDRRSIADRLDGFLRREDSHVAYVYPEPGAAPRQHRVSLEKVDLPDELLTARAPVDPAAAEQPVALAAGRQPVGFETMTVRGLRVFQVRRDAVPLIDIRLIFPVGTTGDEAARPGTALLAATMLDHDISGDYEREDYLTIARVLAMGGVAEAEVSEHATTFRLTGLSTFSDGLLWQMAWLLESGVYDGEALERMQEVLGRRKRARTDDVRAASRMALLYGRGHPYGAQADLAAIRRIDKGDLERFRTQHYRLRGASLVVVGRFDPADMRRRVRELFDRDSEVDQADSARLVVPPARAHAGRLAVADEDAPQVEIDLDIALAGGFDQHAARLVAAEIIERRLDRLRVRFGSTYGVHASIASRPGPGLLSISGLIDSDRAADTFAAMHEQLARLRRGDDELAADFVRARRKVLEQLLARPGDSSSIAAELDFALSHGLPVDHYDRIADQVARMTLSSFRPQLSGILALERAVTYARGPRAKVTALYGAVGATAIRWLR